jgi:hypothetical protein
LFTLGSLIQSGLTGKGTPHTIQNLALPSFIKFHQKAEPKFQVVSSRPAAINGHQRCAILKKGVCDDVEMWYLSALS